MAQYGGTIRWVFEADDTQFNQTVDNVSDKAKELNEIVSQTDKKLSSSLDSTAKSMSKSGSAISGFFKALGSSAKNIGFATLTTGATAATGALTKLASKGIAATDFLETARTGMAGLTGSFEAGNAALSKAAEFWQNNPFDRFTTTRATQQLIQFGRQVNQLSGDLDLLGNVSLSTNTPLDELARFYARTAASGRAMTMDIEMMSDRGIPIYRELAKQLKTTTQGVRDFASKGKIDFETFRKALEGSVNAEAMESFENTLARQKDRLSGSISILAGDLGGYKIINDQLVISEQGLEKAWTRLMKTVATALRSPELREGMAKLGTALASVIDKITPVIEKAIQALAKVIGFIGDHSETLIPIIGALLTVFGKLATQLPFVGNLFTGLSNSIGGLVDSFKLLAKTNPVLATFIVVFGAALVAAFKNSEEFRKSIQRLLQSFIKIGQAILPVFQSIVDVFVRLISSDAVISILEAVANTIATVAEAIASLPVEVLQAVTFAILALNVGLRTSPWVLFVSGVLMAIGALQDWIKSIGGLAEIPKKIGEFFASLPKALEDIGGQVILGFVNGIITNVRWLWETITTICNGVINTFKGVLGIHSPSTVMAEQGRYVALGLAEGITNSKSVVQKAMSNLAKDTLAAAQKVIQNKIDFDVIDIKGQYEAWKKVSELFVKGSEEYKSAIEKMEEVRKQANLQIIKLQEAYNEALDNSIDRIKSFYGLFSTVSETGGMNSEQILKNLDKQVATMQEWASAQEAIAGLDLDEGLVEELQNMGIDAVNELESIAQMSSSELDTLNNMWKKKQEIANNSATTLMSKLKENTLDQINEIKRGIGGETVEVREVGARLVSEISEGITGSLPTLESAYSQLADYMAQAQREMSKSGKASAGAGKIQAPETFNMAQTSLDSVKENIEKSMQNFGGTLAIGAIASLGVGFLLKFGPEIIKWFTKNKSLKKLASSTTEAVTRGVETATQGISKSTEAMGATGKTISKYEQVLSKIAKTAGVVILCAVALAAVAGALWVLNNAIPNDDIGALALKILEVGEVITIIGGLSWIAGKAFEDIAVGLIAVAGIAGDLILLAIGLEKLNRAIPDESVGMMAIKILEVGEAITVIGGLSFAAGILSGAILAGVAAVVGIAYELIKVSEALDAVNQNIPENFEPVNKKIDNMIEVLKRIGGENFGNFISNLKTGIDLSPLTWVMDMFRTISGNVMEIAKVEFNPESVNSKVDALTTVIQHLAGENIPGGGLFEVIGNFFGGSKLDAGTVNNAKEILGHMREIGQTIQNFPEISNKQELLDSIDGYIEVVKKVGSFPDVASMEKKGIAVDHARNLLDRLREFAFSANMLTGASGFTNIENTEGTIDAAKRIISTIAYNFPTDAKAMESKGIVVDHARNLLDRLREFVASGNAIGETEGLQTKVESAISTMNTIVSRISTSVSNQVANFTGVGSSLIQGLIDGISSKNGDVSNAGNQIVLTLSQRIVNEKWQTHQAGVQLGAELIGGVEEKYGNVFDTGKNVANKLNEGIALVNLWESGRNATQGFVNGLTSMDQVVRNAGRQLANTFLTAFKKQAGEGSPWKTTFRSGQFAGEGLIEGLASMESDIINEAEVIADGVSEALDLSDTTITPSISGSRLAPAMDISGSNTSSRQNGVIINQDITNYTPYDVEKVSRDLSWNLARV